MYLTADIGPTGPIGPTGTIIKKVSVLSGTSFSLSATSSPIYYVCKVTGNATVTISPSGFENYALFINSTTTNCVVSMSVTAGTVIGLKTFYVPANSAVEVSYMKADSYVILTNSGVLPVV